MPKKGNFEWIPIEISSQTNSNDGRLEILEKYYRNIPSGRTYKYVFKCNKCNHIFEGTKTSCKCPNCLHINRYENYKGLKTEKYEIIELDHIDPINKNVFFKVKCLKCGDISVKQWGTIKNSKNKQSLGCNKCRGTWKVPTLDAPINAYYSRYKRGAKERNFEFNLTLEEFKQLIFQKCAYCGADPTNDSYINHVCNKTKESLSVNGIDRIDSNKGYSINNCVPCCSTCNKMKLNHTIKFFKDHIKKIYNYLNLEGSETIENTLENNGSE